MNLGYFGLLMGVVLMVYVFWIKYLKVNLIIFRNWVDCDCFVFLVGYGFVMLYSLLYLLGYNVIIDDLKNFC